MSFFRDRIRGGYVAGDQKPTDPIEIFKTLIHQEGYDYLRDVQSEFLQKWNMIRHQRDVVGILNTGAGKTLIGQLMLLSKLNEGVGPVVYLCPDRQLVSQVVDQASLHNIPVVTIAQDPNQPAEFPLEFLNGKAILVTTFERMFNGKSIFGVEGYGHRPILEIGALVIDDAHSCIKKARQQSTILIEREHPAYEKLFALFETAIREQGEGQYISIQQGESSVSRLIPFWIWKQQKDNVLAILQDLLSDDDQAVIYAWGLIGDDISRCQCFISGTQIEITPLQIPVEKIPSFHRAKHRYILSATFNNNADLITELGIDKQAVQNPLKVDNKGDAGERLIIAPKRYYPELTDDVIRPLIAKYSKNYNVVVIVPNSRKARPWLDLGALLVDKDNIVEATRHLKQTRGNLMVFLNRYDGVDLPGDACRILVLDGLPSIHSARDRYISIVREGSPFTDAQVAQTIEQGLGRAVRSGSDHCVVFILDNALLNFIGVDARRAFFAPATRKQLEFGLELFGDEKPTSKEQALEVISEAVEACLTGDSEWRKFHKDLILSAKDDEGDASTHLLEIADIERKALSKYRNDFIEDACELIRELINNNQETMNENDKAWYLQLGAHILDVLNPVQAMDMQVKARSLSSKVLKPPTHTYSKLTRSRGRQADVIYQWLKQYSNATDVVIAIENLYSDLIYSPDVSHLSFEKSVQQIGEFLGFVSQMPEEEEGDGPDNLWRMENGVNVIIEVKNRSTSELVSRSDVEQLLHSIQWHIDKYGRDQQFIPIIMHKGTRCHANVHPSEGSRIMSAALLDQFKSALSQFGRALSQKSPQSWTPSEIQSLLNSYHLTYDKIINTYTMPLR